MAGSRPELRIQIPLTEEQYQLFLSYLVSIAGWWPTDRQTEWFRRRAEGEDWIETMVELATVEEIAQARANAIRPHLRLSDLFW